MKKQVSGYVKPENNADPVPSEVTRCHKRNITCIQIINPEDLKDEEKKTRKSHPLTLIKLRSVAR